jgi:methionine synthase II (cobalamin-independent)
MGFMTTWVRTFQLGIKSLLLHPMRSMLTILGIFIGVASVIWLLAIQRAKGRKDRIGRHPVHETGPAGKKTLGSEWRQYEAVFPKLQQSNIDIISLECHNSRVPMELLELIRGKKVMVGAIDVATHSIETAEDVANTLRQALKYVDADKLYPCTNCGMAPLPRHIASGKLNALAAGAEIVRQELLAG